MRMFRLGAALSVALAAVIAGSSAVPAAEGQPAGGTVTQCPGYPVPPFDVRTEDGVTFTLGNICHVYAGTVQAVVHGVQRTMIFPDGSRRLMGQETLVGSIGPRTGTAELHFMGTRECAPTCPVTVEVRSEEGSGGLAGLHLALTVFGAKTLSYTGSYAFDEQGG